jgi:hypothetical protein
MVLHVLTKCGCHLRKIKAHKSTLSKRWASRNANNRHSHSNPHGKTRAVSHRPWQQTRVPNNNARSSTFIPYTNQLALPYAQGCAQPRGRKRTLIYSTFDL